MSEETTNATLLSKKDTIYKKYYANTIPITELAGGMENTISSAVKTVSQFETPTPRLCNLYFGINAAVIAYMRQDGQRISETYVRNARPSIGSVFSPEQLLANEITLNILGNVITWGSMALAKKIADSVIAKKVKNILKKKTKDEIDDSELQRHAEQIVIKVSNSENVQLNVTKSSVKRGNRRQSKRKNKRISKRQPKKKKNATRKSRKHQ